MRFCTRCGAAVTAEQTFCTSCGAPLAPPPAGPSPASPVAARDPAAETLTAGLPAPGVSQPASSPGRRPPAEILTQDGPPGRGAGKIIVTVVALLALGGGVAAWLLLGRGSAHRTAGSGAPAASQQPSPPAGTSPPGAASTSATTVPGTAPSSTGPPGTSPASTGPAQSQGVTIGAAAGQQAGAQQVAAFLASYFRAINHHQYGRYAALFEPRLRPTPAEFASGYRSTHDSAAVLDGLSGTGAGLAAAVRFRSHQRPADSPTGTACTAWHIVLYLAPRGSSYQIVHPPAGYHARYRAC
jgi:zinc-ribbon domain